MANRVCCVNVKYAPIKQRIDFGDDLLCCFPPRADRITPGKSCCRLSMVLWKIAGADEIPNGSRWYWKSPFVVLIVVYFFDSSSSSSCC